MAYIAKITNTKVSPLTLYFRAPIEVEQGKLKPLISINLAARALNQEVPFADEAYFTAFKNQNSVFLNNGTILIGNTKEKQAEKINEQNAQNEQKNVKAKKDKILNNLTDAVNNSTGKQTNLKMEVSKE